MTSSDQRAYVYLQLPQSLEVVTAGFYELDFPQGVPTGSFVYNPAYLQRADAVPLEPYELPLAPRRMRTVKLKGIFGALRDASPDAWGRRIIEKHTGRTDLTEVDYLLHSPEDRAGALSFGRDKVPPAPARKFNQVIQLPALLAAAEQFLEDEAAGKAGVPEQMLELLQPGTSMGGARPKNVVEDGEGLWLAKFSDRGDKWNNARVEGAMLALAQECGLRVARHRVETVAGKDVLLVQRFDRTLTADGYLRHRMVSGLTALGAEDSHGDRAKWSYLLLADELRRRSARSVQDLEELFRRMVFNALISNTDDHPRNHALIATTDKWELSPAYDLTPNPLTSAEKRDLAMTCGTFNRYANRANLVSQHGQFKLSLEHATAIVDQLQQVVASRWHATLRQKGATLADCDKLAGAFNYPGFELDPAVVLAGQ
ncbi:type II toxin-antitoxin system HipA family toxin [Ottowia testudinis]|uniref:Type II toxin-antitoxin system HipA family toxin n=1 Tax=Ottowia testudinis TaxID=2816950 RepID=A0A975CEZ9_9BURK|nr:HipA domain-containing protein [Ottowia testudinis]QTD43597.1 type II toxin-antitoxin system HipA family toxin [Ottowia testudinis]